MDCRVKPGNDERRICVNSIGMRFSAPLPKFVIHRGTLSHELRKQRGTSKHMILVPLFDLKFLNELAAGGVGTSNRRHWAQRGSRQAQWMALLVFTLRQEIGKTYVVFSASAA